MRYYGGKFRIAEDIVALMPVHSVYVEPFGGAASVLLAKQAAPCEIYNDLCSEVVNVFQQLRDAPEALLRGIWLTPYSREEYERAYESTSDVLEAARRFIYRSTAGIGADSARRPNGFRNTLDDGRYAHAKSWANLPEALELVCQRLRGVIIEHRDAREVMQQFDAPEALHYVDPPYLASTRKQARRAYNHEFMGDDQHEALLAVIGQLKGKVIVSGYDHPMYHQALKGWEIRKFKQRDQRNGHRDEIAWMNYQPEARLL